MRRRYFRIKQVEFLNEKFAINAGIPQDSVMGPLLYVLYTADVPMSPLLLTTTFADDTTLLGSDKDLNKATNILQSYMGKLELWLNTWRKKINYTKCKQMTFTQNRSSCPPISINGSHIPMVDCVNYLGFHLDRRSTWRKHFEFKKCK